MSTDQVGDVRLETTVQQLPHLPFTASGASTYTNLNKERSDENQRVHEVEEELELTDRSNGLRSRRPSSRLGTCTISSAHNKVNNPSRALSSVADHDHEVTRENLGVRVPQEKTSNGAEESSPLKKCVSSNRVMRSGSSSVRGEQPPRINEDRDRDTIITTTPSATRPTTASGHTKVCVASTQRTISLYFLSSILDLSAPVPLVLLFQYDHRIDYTFSL